MSEAGSSLRAWDDAIKFRSRLPGIAFPAVPDEHGMTMLALQFQLERTERWPPAQLRRFQFRQLEALLAHAAAESPYWRAVLAGCGFRPGEALTEAAWHRIPVLARAGIQRDGGAMRARSVPAFHGSVHEVATSGSTGRPVRVLKTELGSLLFDALSLREARWHRRKLAGTVAVVRAVKSPLPKAGRRSAMWNRGIGTALAGGPCVVFDCTRPVHELARAIASVDPDYLLAYPSLLAEFAREADRQRLGFPALAGIGTFGEQLDDDVRRLVAARFGVAIADIYSTEEAGYLAFECPAGGGYHAQSETVLVELLHDDGRECAPGEVGRVVVTPLHNFAMPLIRYDLGDFAEAGGACGCGRTLPMLRRIMGRVRNTLVLADGSRYWPRLNALFNEIDLPLRQVQVVQHAIDRFELRIVAERRFDAGEEERLREALDRIWRNDHPIDITYHDTIPRGPTGKYEDFVCAIGGGEAP